MKNPFPLIKQADLFILSSKFEGLPNVLLESLVLKNLSYQVIAGLVQKKFY